MSAVEGERRAGRFRDAESAVWRGLGISIRDRRIRLGRLGTEVRIQEVGDGDPVLFIHGASTSGTSWATLVAQLPGLRCLVVDRPGAGLSDPLPPALISVDGLKKVASMFVADVLDALDLGTATVVSTSFGGLYAFRSGLADPGRIRRIVEFGWPACAPLGRMPLAMRLGSLPLVGSVAATMPANERSVRAIFRSIGLRRAIESGAVSEEAICAYVALVNHTDTLRNELALSRRIVSPLRGLDPRLALSTDERRAVSMPVRLIWGDADSFGGIDIARAFAADIPDARLEVVPGGGHSIWMEDARLAGDLTRRFLLD
jgi:pimeloyl-ACP methyl ester carboxylesterase